MAYLMLTELTFQGIEAGEEYEVRVVAMNKAGESESAKSSNSIVAKARFVRHNCSLVH